MTGNSNPTSGKKRQKISSNSINNKVDMEDLRNAISKELQLEDEKRLYRRRRRREDLPHPDRPAWAEANRNPRPTREVKLRLEPEVIEFVNRAAKRQRLNRTAWMKAAFLRAAVAEGWDIPKELRQLLEPPANE